MDFGTINTSEDSNRGSTYHVIDPYTEEPAYVKVGKATEAVAVSITLLGPDSDKVRRFQTEMVRASIKKRKTALDPEELERRMTRQIANAIMSWEGIVENGEPMECTAENALELLTKHTWLREQLAGFQQDRANFSKK